MKRLNFPNYEFRLKKEGQKRFIFDLIRKKYVQLSSEEWVRQNCIQYLIREKKYPKSLISVEKKLSINTLTKRYDIIIFNSSGEIYLLVECKSPKVKISQKTFDQLSRYNLAFKSRYVMVTNGLTHYFCEVDYVNKKYSFLKELPTYNRQL